MSMPILTNNMIQQQNILTLNQMPHQIVSNAAATGTVIPIATAITHTPTIVTGEASLPHAGNLVGVQNVAVQGASPSKPVQTSIITGSNEAQQILTKARLNDLVRDVDPTEQLDEDVEDILLCMADDFVEHLLNGACMLAKHRHVNTIEVKDIELHLSKNYNMWVPGLGTDELKPYKRSFSTESHKQRIALIRRALKKY